MNFQDSKNNPNDKFNNLLTRKIKKQNNDYINIESDTTQN